MGRGLDMSEQRHARRPGTTGRPLAQKAPVQEYKREVKAKKALSKRKKALLTESKLTRTRWRWGIRLVMLALVMIVFAQAWKLYDVHQQKVQVQQEVQRLQEENQSLQEEKEALSDMNTVENEARQELGLVKPGEVPYVK